MKRSRILYEKELVKQHYPDEFAHCIEEGMNEIQATLLIMKGKYSESIKEE